jgi:hypothetical protein
MKLEVEGIMQTPSCSEITVGLLGHRKLAGINIDLESVQRVITCSVRDGDNGHQTQPINYSLWSSRGQLHLPLIPSPVSPHFKDNFPLRASNNLPCFVPNPVPRLELPVLIRLEVDAV